MKCRTTNGLRGLAAAAVAVVLSLVSVPLARSAEERGGIRGRIVDSTNLPLPGAFVNVKPGDLTVFTDRDGNYSVPNLAPGSYKVEFSYLGFISVTQDASVTSGTPLRLDASLKPAVNLKEQVEVTASRSRGELEALNQKKNADNIVDVLPEEIITSLPNANIADAVGRLPSVSLERDEGEGKYVQVRGLQPGYTNVTIDGVHVGASELAGGGRAVKLDDVPADLVGSIELSKTLSADQDADAIGGSVNLVTKRPSDQMHFSIGTQQGYTFLTGGRYVTTESGTYSNRFGADKALGVLLGGSWDYNGRGIDDVEPAPSFITLPNGSSIAGLPTADFREYAYGRKRWGVSGGLDYRLAQNSDVYVRGLVSDFYNYGLRWVGTPSAGNFLTPSLTDDTGTFNRSVQNRTPDEMIGSLSAGGTHDLQSLLVDYHLAYSHTRQSRDNQYQANFSGPQNVAYNVNNSDPNFPNFTVANGVNVNDPSLYTFSEFDISHEDTRLNSYEGAANISIPFNLGSSASLFKFGGKYREDDRTNVFGDKAFLANGSQNFTLSQVLDSFSNPNYYFGRYPLGPLIDLDKATNLFFSNPGAFSEDALGDASSNASNNFTTNEKITAGYVMDTLNVGALRIQAGVRVEHTTGGYTGFQVTFDNNGNYTGATPVAANINYTDVDPSIQLRYEIDKNTNFRAVYGQAIARPDIVELVPTIVVSDQNLQVAVGNPNLLPTRSKNYDVLFEHYLGSVGLLSAGGFYKDLSQPIYAATEVLTSGAFAGFTQSSFINGPSAKVYGVEVAWQQHLTFLPGWLNGLGILANYTYTDSKATFDPSFGRTDTPKLQRTTPNEANVNLTYDKGGLSIRGALTYNSATLFAYGFQNGAEGGITGPAGDTYITSHVQIDAQASYTFKSGIKVLASLLNINNQVFGFYNGSPQFNIQREFYGPTLFLGVSLIR